MLLHVLLDPVGRDTIDFRDINTLAATPVDGAQLVDLLPERAVKDRLSLGCLERNFLTHYR